MTKKPSNPSYVHPASLIYLTCLFLFQFISLVSFYKSGNEHIKMKSSIEVHLRIISHYLKLHSYQLYHSYIHTSQKLLFHKIIPFSPARGSPQQFIFTDFTQKKKEVLINHANKNPRNNIQSYLKLHEEIALFILKKCRYDQREALESVTEINLQKSFE